MHVIALQQPFGSPAAASVEAATSALHHVTVKLAAALYTNPE
jgi:hypothetical protein